MPKSQFTKDQEAHLLSFLPTFQLFVEEHDPGLQGKNSQVTEWKKSTASKVLQHALFKDKLDITEKTLADWEIAIIRWFTNRNNYTFKLKPAKLALKKATTSSITTSQTLPTTLATTSHLSPTKAIIRAETHLHRTLQQLSAFTTELSPFDLFAFENDEEITEKYRAYSQETGKPGGGARKHVLSEMWAKADQKFWADRAEEMVNNIEVNQEQFAYIMKIALDNLAQRGRIGSSVFNFYYAYRDKNDGLQSGVIYSGYNTANNTSILSRPLDAEELQDGWADLADKTLPRKSPLRPTIVPFDINEQQLPIFPRVKIQDMSVRDLGSLIQSYLDSLWRHAIKTNPTAFGNSIPWIELKDKPHHFYDIDKYLFPVPLKPVDECSFVEILQLAMYFRELRRLKRHFLFDTQRNQLLFEPSRSPPTSPITFSIVDLPSPSHHTNAIVPCDIYPSIHETLANPDKDENPTEVSVPNSQNSPAMNKSLSLATQNNNTSTGASIPHHTIPNEVLVPNVNLLATIESPDGYSGNNPTHLPSNTAAAPPHHSTAIDDPLEKTENPKSSVGATQKSNSRRNRKENKGKKLPEKIVGSNTSVIPESLGKRKRQPVVFGPRTVIDPSQPPAKKVKPSYHYVAVPINTA